MAEKEVEREEDESYRERGCQEDVWRERERAEEDLAVEIDGEEALLLQVDSANREVQQGNNPYSGASCPSMHQLTKTSSSLSIEAQERWSE
jgi:hypothetical protein